MKDLSLSGSVHVTSSSSFVEFEGSEVITGCVAIGRPNDTTTDGILDYNSKCVKMKSHKYISHNIQVDV